MWGGDGCPLGCHPMVSSWSMYLCSARSLVLMSASLAEGSSGWSPVGGEGWAAGNGLQKAEKGGGGKIVWGCGGLPLLWGLLPALVAGK